MRHTARSRSSAAPHRYLSQYGAACHTAGAYEHNAEFAPVLANRMAYYSSRGGQQADAINRVRGEITEVKHVMIENIDKVRRHGHAWMTLLCKRLYFPVVTGGRAEPWPDQVLDRSE